MGSIDSAESIDSTVGETRLFASGSSTTAIQLPRPLGIYTTRAIDGARFSALLASLRKTSARTLDRTLSRTNLPRDGKKKRTILLAPSLCLARRDISDPSSGVHTQLSIRAAPLVSTCRVPDASSSHPQRRGTRVFQLLARARPRTHIHTWARAPVCTSLPSLGYLLATQAGETRALSAASSFLVLKDPRGFPRSKHSSPLFHRSFKASLFLSLSFLLRQVFYIYCTGTAVSKRGLCLVAVADP